MNTVVHGKCPRCGNQARIETCDSIRNGVRLKLTLYHCSSRTRPPRNGKARGLACPVIREEVAL